MSVEQYLEDQSREGDWHSAGTFTIDLAAAGRKMMEHQLPSPHHQLLKLLQIAVYLGADSVQIRSNLMDASLSFWSRHEAPLNEAFVASLGADKNQESCFLTSALFSCVTAGGSEVVWAVSGKKGSSRLRIQKHGRVYYERGQCRLDCHQPGEVSPKHVRHDLSLVHAKSWNLWTMTSRRVQIANLLRESARFAGLRILLNGTELEPQPSAVLNDHLTEFGGSRFNAATGVMQNVRSPAVASNLVFAIATQDQPGVRLATPRLDSFTERDGCIVWRRGLRGGPEHDLRPDGVEEPAWLLQFLAPTRALSFTEIPSEPRCRAIAALHIHGPGSGEGVRVIVVRYGIVCLESTEQVEGLEDLMGCSLLFADEDLDTDLGGLRVVKNAKYYQRLRGFIPMIEKAHSHFRKAAEILAVY